MDESTDHGDADDEPSWKRFLPNNPSERIDMQGESQISIWRDERRECIHLLAERRPPHATYAFTGCHDILVVTEWNSRRWDLDDPETVFEDAFGLVPLSESPELFVALDPANESPPDEERGICTECLRSAREYDADEWFLYRYTGDGNAPYRVESRSESHVVARRPAGDPNHLRGEVCCQRVDFDPELVVLGEDSADHNLRTTDPEAVVAGNVCERCLAYYHRTVWSDSPDKVGILVTTDREPSKPGALNEEYLSEYLAQSVDLVADGELLLELTSFDGHTVRVPADAVEDVSVSRRHLTT